MDVAPHTTAARQSAIVIGGGVIGCTTAYYLSKFGWRVQLVEKARVGSGCSHGNCGFICPSHVLPLTKPGTVWPVMKRMFSRDSAIYLKRRWDPTLWRWLTQFAKNCTPSSMERAAAARHALLTSSMELYRQLIVEESLQVDWEDRGLLLVFKAPQEFAAHEKHATFLRNEFGIAASALDAKQLSAFESALRPGAAGAWHYPDDSHLRPDRLMHALREVLRSRGVEILEGADVVRFHIESGRARALETSRGTLEASAYVLATGARAPALAAQLGGNLPIQPAKGYSITLPRTKIAPRTPIIFEEHHVAVTPWQSGLRVGSTMEFAGYDAAINRRRIELFKRVAAENLVDADTDQVEEEWSGWRPMTCDDVPCIGPAPRAKNVIIAAGHGMIGMATATASGKLTAELVASAKPHLDPAPYSLERFRT